MLLTYNWGNEDNLTPEQIEKRRNTRLFLLFISLLIIGTVLINKTKK